MDKAEQPTITLADELLREIFLHGHSEGWTGNQTRRDVQHVDAEKGWSLYASNGALEKTKARHRTTSLAAQDGLVCTGCGSTKSIEQIRAEHPSALSCCPERKMVSQIGDIVERLNCLHVWPQSIASTYADTLTPRQIERLYDVGNVATEAASTIATLRKQLAAQDGLVEAVAEALLSAFLAGRGSVTADGRKAYKPAPSMADFRNIALSAIKEQHHD